MALASYRVPFLEAIKIRRSTVALAKESPISDERIVMIVNHAIKYAPSAFHVQSCRALVIFGAHHDKLWDIAFKETKKEMPPQAFEQFAPKIQGYKDAYGTVSCETSLHLYLQKFHALSFTLWLWN